MRSTVLVLLTCIALAAGCGSERPQPPTVVSATGTVELQNVEGGVWLIRADTGDVYAPTNLPATFQVTGARVQVQFVERRDLATVPRPGVPVEIVHIDEVACTVPCPAPGPAITVHVLGGSPDVSIANLTTPPLPAGSSPPAVSCAPTVQAGQTCTIDARVAGTYSFDVVMPGAPTAHDEETIRPYQHVPGICCEPAFVGAVVFIPFP